MDYGNVESQILVATLGSSPDPPVRLHDVITKLGVSVCWTPCRTGFTDFRHSVPEIHLTPTETGAQMRLVLAHELAHVMIRTPKVRHLLQRSQQADLLADEEKLANRVADALLLPDSWIRGISRSTLTLSRLEHVARLADVSPPMLVARMASMGLDVALLQWRQGSTSWHVVDRPGVPSSLHGYLKISETGRKAIEGLSAQESKLTVSGSINGMPVTICGLAYRSGAHAIQLIMPTHGISFDHGRTAHILPVQFRAA